MSFNIIVKKSSDDKNKTYRKARQLKEKFKDNMLNHTEMWRPTKDNIKKCMEFDKCHTNDVTEYRECMKKLDKDPDARNTEKLRRHW